MTPIHVTIKHNSSVWLVQRVYCRKLSCLARMGHLIILDAISSAKTKLNSLQGYITCNLQIRYQSCKSRLNSNGPQLQENPPIHHLHSNNSIFYSTIQKKTLALWGPSFIYCTVLSHTQQTFWTWTQDICRVKLLLKKSQVSCVDMMQLGGHGNFL